MNPFIQQMINYKINTMTPKQLCQLGEQYNMPISMKQARRITDILHQQPIDILDETQRKRILNQISKEVDPALAQKAKSLLEVFL
ncbi:MAG TPA: DUF2624 family protein [Bacillales bacterium]|nr:DUF2624 family protein [Bacillales bacterium]